MEQKVVTAVAFFGFFATTIGVFANLVQIRQGLNSSKVILLVAFSIGSACFLTILQSSSNLPNPEVEKIDNRIPGQAQQDISPTQNSVPVPTPFFVPTPTVISSARGNYPQFQSMLYQGQPLPDNALQIYGPGFANIEFCVADFEADIVSIHWIMVRTTMTDWRLPYSLWYREFSGCHEVSFECRTGGGVLIEIQGTIVDSANHMTQIPSFVLTCL